MEHREDSQSRKFGVCSCSDSPSDRNLKVPGTTTRKRGVRNCVPAVRWREPACRSPCFPPPLPHTFGFGASATADELPPSPDNGADAASASLAALAASARWYGRCHGTKKSAPPLPPSVLEAVGAV